MARVTKLPRDSGATGVAPLVNPIFIADLHLSWRKLGAARAFFQFLKTDATRYEELFILGDLFEFWLGDDTAFLARPVIRALKSYVDSGHKLYFVQGNRDALLGEDFAKACGGTLLATPQAVTFGELNILIAHGDEWCTLDKPYQEFRKLLRSKDFQEEAFSMSVISRLIWALRARKRSIQYKTQKTREEMDVVEADVFKKAKALNCPFIVHGHTHKPAVHYVDGFMRLVLPDWRFEDAKKIQYGWVEIDPVNGPLLILRH